MTDRLITIVGPTASGKTPFAAALAAMLDGEILGADSRQVYREMDLGTGKDLSDYCVNGIDVPHHLIDICNAGEKYNLFEYQQDFHKAYRNVVERGKRPILCGGTGLYIEAVLKGYQLVAVPEDKLLRERLSLFSLEELTERLSSYKQMHNRSDIDTVKRAIRAIEIAEYSRLHEATVITQPPIDSTIIGLNIERELRREKISRRLKVRLAEGMIDEVQGLLDAGIAPEDLIYYGLEYKYLTLHLTGMLTRDEMIKGLEVAIHQFAKRQMTWFRGMERRGFAIHWIDATRSMQEKLEQALSIISSKNQQ